MRESALEKVPIAIGSSQFGLCGNFGQLVKAEEFYGQTVHDVNLARAATYMREPGSSLSGVRQLLPCALRAFHPEMSWKEVQGMVDNLSAHQVSLLVQAISTMWPAQTVETEAANKNLCCRLEDLAEANEFFAGQAELALTCLEGPFTLGHVWRVFPCALHRFRPELSLQEARRLMTLDSVFLIMSLMETENRNASQARRNRFAQRTVAAATENEKQEIVRRLLAKQTWVHAPIA